MSCGQHLRTAFCIGSRATQGIMSEWSGKPMGQQR